MGQQIATFEEMYPKVTENGVFLIEDLHTNYWKKYGGGYQKSGTFMEYVKPLTDQLNAWHSREPELVVDQFTRTTRSMHSTTASSCSRRKWCRNRMPRRPATLLMPGATTPPLLPLETSSRNSG
jgi:hypothetical protein